MWDLFLEASSQCLLFVLRLLSGKSSCLVQGRFKVKLSTLNR
nr:MAG TPA: hypothetical protein [Caudoviricetes sp.]